MKFNRILLISMVIISLLAIGAVSASENVSDVIKTSDVNDVVTVENDVATFDNLSKEIENEQIDLSENEPTEVSESESALLSQSNPVVVNVADDGINKDDSLSDGFDLSGLFGGNSTFDLGALFGNGTGLNLTDFDLSGIFGGNGIDFGALFGNGTGLNLTDFDFGALFGNGTGLNLTGFDLSGIFGGNGTGLNLTDLIGNLFGGNGTNATFDWSSIFGGNTTGNNTNTSSFDMSGIIDMITGKKDSINSTDLTTYYAKKTNFKVTVMSGDKPLTSGSVVFTINNKEYASKIGSDGVATLSQKLKPGTYFITTEYAQTIVKNKIVIKKSIITKNVSKKFKKAGKFTVKVLNTKGKAHAKQTVKIKLKGKTYTAKTNKKGIATFKLPKNLKVGKYTIKTTCKGLTISNKLTVKK